MTRENGWLLGKVCGKIIKEIFLGTMKYIESKAIIICMVRVTNTNQWLLEGVCFLLTDALV